MSEINDIAKIIADSIDSSAKIIFGAYHDRKLKHGQIKVTLIATSFNGGSLVKKPELTSVTNLFGERVSVDSKLEVKPVLLEQKNLAFANNVKEEVVSTNKNDASKKKVADIWDIPAFLRKKKK